MKKEIIVSIHQPNFFPWLGFFDKIKRSDIFILLDNVQFPKKGGTWINRVKMLIGGEPAWVTVPVIRSYHGFRSINAMEMDNHPKWRKKIVRAVEINYRKAPFFSDVFPVFESLVLNPVSNIAEYNINCIRVIADKVGLDTGKFILGSMIDSEFDSTRMLIDMVKKVGGTTYICGGGAAGYQEDFLFDEQGINLVYQEFEHPVYKQFQRDEFVPGLSILDYLMNAGWNEI